MIMVKTVDLDLIYKEADKLNKDRATHLEENLNSILEEINPTDVITMTIDTRNDILIIVYKVREV